MLNQQNDVSVDGSAGFLPPAGDQALAQNVNTLGETIIGPLLGDGPSRRTMPRDYAIALKPGTGSDVRTAAQGRAGTGRRQSMHGFEDTYVDVIDYILRVTHRIWEDQDVGYIYDTYAPGCFVFDDTGAHWGVERVVTATMQSLHTFPDLRSHADEVIWAGNDVEGFVTSHRYITTGHHLGPWEYGPATGRRVNMWGIANCVIKDNEIFEEWVLYNTASKLAQVGVDVSVAARAYGNEMRAFPVADRYLPEVSRLEGGRKPEYYPPAAPGEFDAEHFVRKLFHDTYNRRDLSTVERTYAQTVRWRSASNRTGFGREDVKGFARSLMATFPDLGLRVDEVYWMGNDAEGYRISARWSAGGTHRGYGLYGRPTGRRVRLWGISQLYVTVTESGPRVTEEWNMFNEFDVMAQILADEPAQMIP